MFVLIYVSPITCPEEDYCAKMATAIVAQVRDALGAARAPRAQDPAHHRQLALKWQEAIAIKTQDHMQDRKQYICICILIHIYVYLYIDVCTHTYMGVSI